MTPVELISKSDSRLAKQPPRHGGFRAADTHEATEIPIINVVFGENATRWLSRQKEAGPTRKELKKDLDATIATLAADQRLKAQLENPRGEHTLATVIHRCIELDLNLGTKDLRLFCKAAKRQEIPCEGVQMTCESFLLLTAGLSHTKIKDLLIDPTYLSLSKENKFVKLVCTLDNLNLLGSSQHLAHIYSGLPKELKEQMMCIFLPLDELKALRINLKDSRVVTYLASPDFKNLPKEDKLVELVCTLDKYKLLGSSQNLAQIYSGLPKELKDQMMKINLPLAELQALRINLENPAVVTFLDLPDFKDLPKEHKLVELVCTLDKYKLLGSSQHLAQIYSGLPKELKEQMMKINLPLDEMRSIRLFLSLHTTIDWIESTLKKLPRAERLQVLLWKYNNNAEIRSNRMKLFNALPHRLSQNIYRGDFMAGCLRLDLPDHTEPVYLDSNHERVVAQLLYKYGLINQFKEGENLQVKSGLSKITLDFKIETIFIEYHPLSRGERENNITIEEAGNRKIESLCQEKYPGHEVIHIWELRQLYNILLNNPALNKMMLPEFKNLQQSDFVKHLMKAKDMGHKIDREISQVGSD